MVGVVLYTRTKCHSYGKSDIACLFIYSQWPENDFLFVVGQQMFLNPQKGFICVK